jgi:hypothetical protein
MKEELITPEEFWKLYKEMLKGVGDIIAYRDASIWTKKVIDKVRIMINKDLELETQKEYFRIDAIGYTTKWEEEKQIAEHRKKYEGIKMHPLHNWKLKVAYEHENSDGWSDELCKLCHIAADLKVISSYYGSNKDDIEKTLKYYIERLDSEGTMRRAEGQWLFVFGLYWFSVNWTNAFNCLHLFLLDSPLANQGFLRHKGIKNTF